jgi:hypothetical protein
MSNSVLLVIVGIADVGAFVVAAVFYIRTVEAITGIIREKQPDGWKRGLLDSFEHPEGDPRQPFWYWWMIEIIFGVKRLNLADESYHKLLWRARKWFAIGLLLMVVFIVGLGWFTQGTAYH